MKLGCILLASGFGTRFGDNKLFVQVEGSPLYARALAAFPAELFARRVLTSRFEEILALGGREGWLSLYNENAGEGVAAGIRLGLAALEDMDGVLFAVCDQPWLTAGSVARLAAAFRARPDRITALGWKGKKGNPVIFPRDLFPELMALRGDAGGSAVICRHLHRLATVEAGAGRELWDVDRPEDLTNGRET